jgi:dTDP-4-dehydrorhamnose reductase
MKVLVTGAFGQVGAALTRSTPPGCDVIAVSREQLDIADPRAVGKLVGDCEPELIVNAAAYTAVDKAENERSEALAGNEVGPRNLAEAAARCGARLIHLSTDFVFDGLSSAPYRPDDRPAPLGVYGTTKLAGERAVIDRLKDKALVLRTAWVYAATGRNFLLTMLRLMREKGSVRVVADQIGTPTAAESVARAIWLLADRPALHGVFHWTDAGVASWYDFAVAIAEEGFATGLLPRVADVLPIQTADYPTAARRPRFSVLDTRSTREAIGSVAPHWRASLRRVLGEIPRG